MLFQINKYPPSTYFNSSNTSHMLELTHLVENKPVCIVKFGPISYLLNDIYDEISIMNFHDNEYTSKRIFDTPNKILSLLNKEELSTLTDYYKEIIEFIDNEGNSYNYDVVEITSNIINLVYRFKLKDVLAKTELDSLDLLYHATNSNLKEIFSKEHHQQLIEIGIIMKFIIPIINYYHHKFTNYNTIYFSNSLYSIMYELFPVVSNIRDIIKHTLLYKMPNTNYNDFKYSCILLENTIYFYLLTYYDRSILTENNNIINIINKYIVNESENIVNIEIS